MVMNTSGANSIGIDYVQTPVQGMVLRGEPYGLVYRGGSSSLWGLYVDMFNNPVAANSIGVNVQLKGQAASDVTGVGVQTTADVPNLGFSYGVGSSIIHTGLGNGIGVDGTAFSNGSAGSTSYGGYFASFGKAGGTCASDLVAVRGEASYNGGTTGKLIGGQFLAFGGANNGALTGAEIQAFGSNASPVTGSLVTAIGSTTQNIGISLTAAGAGSKGIYYPFAPITGIDLQAVTTGIKVNGLASTTNGINIDMATNPVAGGSAAINVTLKGQPSSNVNGIVSTTTADVPLNQTSSALYGGMFQTGVGTGNALTGLAVGTGAAGSYAIGAGCFAYGGGGGSASNLIGTNAFAWDFSGTTGTITGLYATGFGGAASGSVSGEIVAAIGANANAVTGISVAANGSTASNTGISLSTSGTGSTGLLFLTAPVTGIDMQASTTGLNFTGLGTTTAGISLDMSTNPAPAGSRGIRLTMTGQAGSSVDGINSQITTDVPVGGTGNAIVGTVTHNGVGNGFAVSGNALSNATSGLSVSGIFQTVSTSAACGAELVGSYSTVSYGLGTTGFMFGARVDAEGGPAAGPVTGAWINAVGNNGNVTNGLIVSGTGSTTSETGIIIDESGGPTDGNIYGEAIRTTGANANPAVGLLVNTSGSTTSNTGISVGASNPGAVALDVTQGPVRASATVGNRFADTKTLAGGAATEAIANSVATTTSTIVLTFQGTAARANALGSLLITALANGSFTVGNAAGVNFANTDVVHYIIINH
jgi:hypothetical protein